MFDVALKTGGANIVQATSCDDRYPPENIIDGDDQTFWVTTGMFPQEFIVSFASLMDLKRINIACYHVREVTFESSSEHEPNKFEPVAERELESTDSHLQSEEISVPSGTKASHLRVRIKSGYDHFVSIHKLSIDGNAVHG